MLSSPSRMNIHQPIARYIHFYIYRKKIFVRGVVRGIHFEKSLLQRLSPEGGQNWHKWPSPMCYYMHKSHLYTTLTHQSGRKQRLLPIAPPVLSDISSSGSTALLRTTGSSFLPVKRQDWQNSLFSPSGTLLQTLSIVWSPRKYIIFHFYQHLASKPLKMAQNDPLRAPTHPDKSANSEPTGQNF